MKNLDALLRQWTGVGMAWAVALILVLMVAGAAIGWLFPTFEATALLQFPEAQKPVEPRTIEQRTLDPKGNVIEFAAFKRVAASYDSPDQLRDYFQAIGVSDQPAAAGLVRQAGGAAFWNTVATPVLPVSRRDLKEFGDIKDAAANVMLGLELVAGAQSPVLAQEMINLLASYYVNAVVRERFRTWALAGRVDAQSQEKTLRADILKAELDIELFGQRANDMKAILTRHPDAARMDARQVVSVNLAEGGERYLSPLAQLVGAESAISQRRELVHRWQRELKQKSLLATFFNDAEALIDHEIEISKLFLSLRELAAKRFAGADAAQEWHKEAELRVYGAMDNFEVMRSQFGVRNGVRVAGLSSRSPTRLGGLAAAAGIGLLAGLAFLRAGMSSARMREELE
jgi:hypothetical protein